MFAASLPDWLTAIGGLGAFVATVCLAVLARKQMLAAEDQVKIMRQTSEDESKAVREQIEASVAQGAAIREAARAQLQPIVFGHGLASQVRGADNDYRLAIGPGEVAFPYYIANEGDGIALDVHHGVEIDGVDYAFGKGLGHRSLRPGESSPPRDDYGAPVQVTPLAVVVSEAELPADWGLLARRYWTRFENVFGERFETRVPGDPYQSATFTRLTR